MRAHTLGRSVSSEPVCVWCVVERERERAGNGAHSTAAVSEHGLIPNSLLSVMFQAKAAKE